MDTCQHQKSSMLAKDTQEKKKRDEEGEIIRKGLWSCMTRHQANMQHGNINMGQYQHTSTH